MQLLFLWRQQALAGAMFAFSYIKHMLPSQICAFPHVDVYGLQSGV